MCMPNHERVMTPRRRLREPDRRVAPLWPACVIACLGRPTGTAGRHAFGLAAAVWTKDISKAHAIANKLRAGTVWVNTYRAVSFTMPFGGYKASGLGRENGADAIEGYLQTKSVWINNAVGGGGNPFVMKTASNS